jgi:toxin YoeB
MRKIIFESQAFEQFNEIANSNKKAFNKVSKLIIESTSNPFSGSGKPEPLKHQLKGYWSRRIDLKNRLVYKVTDDSIIIISCLYHYED